MRPDPADPTRDEHDDEVHPAWGLIGASRVSTSPPGASLFDSDIRHHHFVVVRVKRASRKRNLMRDWLHPRRGEQIVEVAMSEAQWASFVSSMNVGEGVPCTIETVGKERMPGVVHEPRLAATMEEVSNAATKAIGEIQTAFSAYKEKPTAEKRRSLEAAINNAPSNITFAAKSLSEHAENVVQRARADIEAMVVSKAEQLGLDPAEVADVRLLEDGS